MLATYLAKFSIRTWGLIALVVALVILIILACIPLYQLLPDGSGTVAKIERTTMQVQQQETKASKELNDAVEEVETKVHRRTTRAVERVARTSDSGVDRAFLLGVCESSIYRDDPKCSGGR